MTYLDHPISLAFPIFLLFFSVISKHLPWLNAFAGVFRQTEIKTTGSTGGFDLLFFLEFKGISADVDSAGEVVSLGDSLLWVVEHDCDLARGTFHNEMVA